MDAQDKKCPTCGAEPGFSCDFEKFPTGHPRDFHETREAAAEEDDSNAQE